MKFLPITSTKTLSYCRNLNVDDQTAIFVASYPKSGTTWMQWIALNLLSNNPSLITLDSSFHISKFSPFYEIDPHWEDDGQFSSLFSENHESLGSKLFNTHLPFKNMPLGRRAKYIYVVRNGKDVCTSFFYHLTNQTDNGGLECNFPEFLTNWCDGEIYYGNWLEHVKEWVLASQEQSNNILIVRYEDLKSNLIDSLLKIAKHIQSTKTEEEIMELAPKFSFSFMKEHMNCFQPISVSWKPGFDFIRKGEVGDHVNLFGPEENTIYSDMFRSKFPDGVPPSMEYFI